MLQVRAKGPRALDPPDRPGGPATWLLHDRRQRGFKWIQLAGIAAMTAVAVAATTRVIQESQAFGVAKTPLGDEGEKQRSFPTLVTLLMLVLN